MKEKKAVNDRSAFEEITYENTLDKINNITKQLLFENLKLLLAFAKGLFKTQN